jgi:hypothetical protein
VYRGKPNETVLQVSESGWRRLRWRRTDWGQTLQAIRVLSRRGRWGLTGNGLTVQGGPFVIHLHRPDWPQCYDLHVSQNLAPIGFSASHHGPLREVPPMRARFLSAPRDRGTLQRHDCQRRISCKEVLLHLPLLCRFPRAGPLASFKAFVSKPS